MYNFDFIVYKSLSAQKPFWKIFRYNEESNNCEFLGMLPVGAMTAIGLNDTIRSVSMMAEPSHEMPTYIFRSSSQGDYQSAVITEGIRYLSPEKLGKLIDHINELAEMCEIAKKRGNSRKISHEDYTLLYPYYLKLKDIVFIADLKEVFDIDYVYDYLHCNGLLKVRDYDTIIKKTAIKTLADGKDYQGYGLADLDAFFALDLEEVLFGTEAFPKFQKCRECGEVYVTNNLKSQYCPKCDDKTKRSRNRKKRWRQDKMNVLGEEVNNLYNQLIEFIRANQKNDNLIYIEQGEFMRELGILKNAVRKHTPSDSADTMTEEQVIKWLMTKRAELKERLKAYDYK